MQCIDVVLTGNFGTGSSVPSAYSGSAFASVPGLGSRPSHSIDVSRPAAGEAQRFAAQVRSQPTALGRSIFLGCSTLHMYISVYVCIYTCMYVCI